MGFRISFIAAKMPVDDLIKGMELETTSISNEDEPPYGEPFWATQLVSGYALLWSEDTLFGYNRQAKLADLSERAVVYSSIINETVMVSSLWAVHRRNTIWDMSWNGEQGPVPDNLTVKGKYPDAFDEALKVALAEHASEPEFDPFFEVPCRVGERIFGFRHDAYLKPDDFDHFRILRPLAAEPRKGLLARLFGGSK